MSDTIALVGGETLLGREVQEVLAGSLPGADLRLVASSDEDSGKLTEIGGAASFLAKLQPDAVAHAAAVILAGAEKASRDVLEAEPAGIVIDLTYALEDEMDGRLRAPLVPGADEAGDGEGPQIIAHPAAVAVALLFGALHRVYPISRGLVHIFEPASERGKEGIEELQQQTVNLMSLKPLPTGVFDTQLSFNMLSQFGGEAPTTLADVEERIERHLATLLARLDGPPMPSLKLIQAPVFHGYGFSVWLEFEDSPSVGELEEALNGSALDVRSADVEPPNNVNMAGQSGVAIGAITPDRNNGSAVWIWMAADNLRLLADSAAMVVREAL